jgi:hypothetical protein
LIGPEAQVAGVILVAAALLLAACGGQPAAVHATGPSVPVTWNHQDQCQGAGFGRTQNPAPAKLPSDFPVYPGAQVYLDPYDGGNGVVAAAWTVSGTISGPSDWYKAHLQSGDFQLYGQQYSDPCGASYRFERRSNSHLGGYVGVVSGLAGPGKTLIAISIGPKQ